MTQSMTDGVPPRQRAVMLAEERVDVNGWLDPCVAIPLAESEGGPHLLCCPAF